MKEAFYKGLLRGFKGHYNLQMFAGDGEGGDGGEGGQENPDDPTKDEDKPEVKYTEDDVNKIINKKFAEWEKKRKKEVDEAAKLAQMDAQQKAEYERDKLQKELDDLKKDKATNEMARTARKMLQDEAINAPDELLGLLIGDTAETTKEAVDSFIDLFKTTVQDSVKEALKGNPPKTGNNTTITKEQILAIKNPAERKQKIAENIHLFNK